MPTRTAKTPAKKAPARKAPAKTTTAAKKAPSKTARPKLKGQIMGTMKAVKAASKKGGGGGESNWLKRIPNDGITVRFMTEPDEWFGYMRYWDSDAETYVPMLDGESAPKGARSQFRFVASALDTAAGKVVALDVPKSLSANMTVYYDKYGTIMDRDYEAISAGEGMDITYQIIPESPRKKSLAKYDAIDLEEFLLSMRDDALAKINGEVDDDDEEEDEDEDAEEAEDEEEEEEEEDEEEEELDLEALGAAADEDVVDAQTTLTELAAENDLNPDDYPTWTELAEVLGAEDEEESEEEEDDAEEAEDEIDFGELGSDADEDDADAQAVLTEWAGEHDLDPDDFPTWAELAAAIVEANDGGEEADGEEEEENEDGDEDEITEEDLTAMSVKELRALAEEFDVDFAGMKKAQLIEALMEAAGEE